MADFVSALKADLVEQFRGKENIEGLVEVIGIQLQAVYDFYEQLRNERDVYTAVGKQLDGVGDIAVMTRKEAGQLAGKPIPFEVIDDDTYRQYLIYKILKNTCDCTYPDIIKAFRMFWDRPLYYTEDPDEPATMIFDTGDLPGNHATVQDSAHSGGRHHPTVDCPDYDGDGDRMASYQKRPWVRCNGDYTAGIREAD